MLAQVGTATPGDAQLSPYFGYRPHTGNLRASSFGPVQAIKRQGPPGVLTKRIRSPDQNHSLPCFNSIMLPVCLKLLKSVNSTAALISHSRLLTAVKLLKYIKCQMSRPGVSEDRKFLNVRIAARVITKAKVAASLSQPPLTLNQYVEKTLDGASPEKKGKDHESKATAHTRRSH